MEKSGNGELLSSHVISYFARKCCQVICLFLWHKIKYWFRKKLRSDHFCQLTITKSGFTFIYFLKFGTQIVSTTDFVVASQDKVVPR